MDSNKNILENLVQAQTKSVNNFVETTKKVQDSLLKGDLESTTDIYKSWLDNQKSIVAESMNGEKNKQTTDSTSAANGAAATTDLFTTWMNAQAQFSKTWMESFSKMTTAPAAASPMEMFNEASKVYTQWTNLFSNVLNHTSGQLNGAKNVFAGLGDINNSFSQMLNSSNVYMKMYEMWQPMMQQAMSAMQTNGNPAMENLMKAFNPEKLRETMDSVFQFASADKFKEIYSQFSSISERMHQQQKDMQEQFLGQMKQMGAAFPDSYATFSNSLHNNPYVKQMEQAFAPLTRLMPAGKEKEAMDAWMQVKDKFAAYWTKYNEMQYIIYTTGQHAMEKVVENVMATAKETKSLPDFKEVYNNWMNTTEKLMIETFGSDEFSKVQGELLTTGSEIKRIIEKQMERTLEGLPLVPRSEADEMAQTIHDLKARVRNLEKELRNQKSGQPEAATFETAKKTAKK